MAGFVSIELPSGLIINNAKLMTGPAGKHWIAMPAVKQLDRDGNPRLDANSKAVWSAIIEFRDRATRDEFQEPVLGALRRHHPEAFDDERAP